jgi:hypothetical protein
MKGLNLLQTKPLIEKIVFELSFNEKNAFHSLNPEDCTHKYTQKIVSYAPQYQLNNVQVVEYKCLDCPTTQNKPFNY